MLCFYFSPFGRVSRKGFWLGFVIPYFVVLVILSLVFVNALPDGYDNDPRIVSGLFAERLILISPIILVLWWASFVAFVKRLHDRNISGFWILPSIVFAFLGNGLQVYYPQNLHDWSWLLIGLGWLVFVISIWLFVNAYILRGNRGANKYGADPLVTET